MPGLEYMGKGTNAMVVARLKEGNLDAFDNLYHQYKGKLFGFCFKMTQNKDDAMDIVQEVFIKIWEIRELLDENRSFDSLLFTISKNLIYNRTRKNVFEQAYKAYLFQENLSKVYDLTAYMEHAEQGKLIEDAIEELPEKRQQIFVMSRKEGLSNKEISEKLGTSLSNVENQLYKALKALRRVLQ